MEQQKDEAWWRGHLEAIEREGIPTKAYAQREGLSVGQLYGWRKRIKKRAGRAAAGSAGLSQFLAVQVESASASTPVRSPCTLVTTSGVRLELPQLPSPQWLAELDARLWPRQS